MKRIIPRPIDLESVKQLIRIFPVTAILGPRQCGKTVLAKQVKYNHYFDLENPRDIAQFQNPQLTLENLTGLIVIDEIQRLPNLFTLIRYLVDNNSRQKYLILGSASRDLIRQSSESLAGRIGYFNLGGFRISDIHETDITKLWLRGGFPDSYTADSLQESLLWRENYITTFLERDIPQLGISIPAHTLRRFWTMVSHYHAQVLNYSELARSFGISDMTARKYVDILAGTFMIRLLQPWYSNVGKRVIKRPKLFLRDSGIFHSLLSIETHNDLLSHNKLGASWEGFAMECACRTLGKADETLYFWGTHSGAEVDLFWQHAGRNWAIEFKYCDAPKITKSMRSVSVDLNLSHLWVVYPGKTEYKLAPQITALPLQNLFKLEAYGK